MNRDPQLSVVRDYVLRGWPDCCDPGLKLFQNKKSELCTSRLHYLPGAQELLYLSRGEKRYFKSCISFLSLALKKSSISLLTKYVPLSVTTISEIFSKDVCVVARYQPGYREICSYASAVLVKIYNQHLLLLHSVHGNGPRDHSLGYIWTLQAHSKIKCS